MTPMPIEVVLFDKIKVGTEAAKAKFAKAMIANIATNKVKGYLV